MANPPAGWHPDPLTRHAQRYWDGNQWTEHVADQSGNMTTDPLDGGQSAQQTDQAAQADQGQADQGGWGESSAGQQDTAQQDTSWGSPDSSQTSSDTWVGGSTDTTGSATTDDGPAWGDSATSDPEADHAAMIDESLGDAGVSDAHAADGEAGETDATTEPAWGDGAGAAGAAAAAGAVAAGESDDTSDSWEPSDRATTDLGAAHASSASSDPSGQRHIVDFDVTDGVVVRHGHVVASSGGVVLDDSEHPGSMRASGDGTVWVGAAGRSITVVDVPDAGLTVRDDALVAHTDGLDRSAASHGIVGVDATSVHGTGRVAVAAPGGTLEISPAGGVDVAVGSLVAWSSNLDVAHAEHVNLAGDGMVLLAPGA